MVNKRFAAAVIAALSLSAAALAQPSDAVDRQRYDLALELYQRGMYDRARVIFDELSRRESECSTDGYAALCSACMKAVGYEETVRSYISRYPYSTLVPVLHRRWGLNLFDAEDYVGASEQLEAVSRKDVDKKDLPEFLFKKAYCDFENGLYDRAAERFTEVETMGGADYSGPSRYALGYIAYQNSDFAKAYDWFEKAASDKRFENISDYYMAECRFMLKDYDYVVSKGVEMMDKVPVERQPQLARMISESYLVKGDAAKAREYYELNRTSNGSMNRSDYFYSGSVLYAVQDYAGAIQNYSKMQDRSDSLGQIANYQLGYSYIQTGNKVAALRSFQEASSAVFDKAVQEDAFFNYAKLAFDLNNDSSAFNEYLLRYPDARKGDRIYGYMAVAALYNRDYAAAVEAFNNIDELDPDMRSNYMKANYLRAAELVSDGSFRNAVPCLRAAAYYSDKNGKFNQMSRFWLAESYFRSGDYEKSRETFTELYNVSALYGMDEYDLIPYSIAYNYFMEEDYKNAIKWFDEYLSGRETVYRKGASIRKGDCWFMQSKYKEAAAIYEGVMKDYYNVNDIYPYYQAALCYGLTGNNSKKISLLSNVKSADPASAYYSEAMYELGRAYVDNSKLQEAQDCFVNIVGQGRDSTYMARALIELGMLSRNSSDYDKAMAYYKMVVEQMPLSEYADDALAAIESICQTRNEPYEYLAYIESIGRSGIKNESEKESMIFNAAEQIFLGENYEKALVALQNYEHDFPQGKMTSKADFYIAECYRSLGQKEQACDYYSKVVENGSGSFIELSMLHFSNLSYSLQRYDDAYGGYSSLYGNALLEGNKFTALTGMMRSAFRARRYEDAIDNAVKVEQDSRSDKALKREALFTEARSYLATSRRKEAFALLGELAKNPSDAEGAEAAYMVIQDCFDRAEYGAVESKVYAFSDSGTGQQYWLAKSFIVLGDAFLARNDSQQAEATWKSILSGYKPQSSNDDIHDIVNMRLSKLQEN